jgi:hypothetical protein
MSAAGAATLNNGLTLTDGDLVLANGHGISFSATADSSATNASTSSEILDDYEEGTWTPTVSGNSTCSMDTVHNSYYTKIGRAVTLNTTFNLNSSAVPATGTLIFAGFPFAFKTQGESAFLITLYYNYKPSPMAFMNVNGNVYYQKTDVGGNNLGNLTEAIDADNQMMFNFTYLTDD